MLEVLLQMLEEMSDFVSYDYDVELDYLSVVADDFQYADDYEIEQSEDYDYQAWLAFVSFLEQHCLLHDVCSYYFEHLEVFAACSSEME